ncbi:hypothetical protein [Streptacidiphilus anmyonensis]|uniref:hypothetical protein n=1 Tax=Streptacidiphilus anmyonensis TaxID=405782 RepID=UPI000AAC655B|nr:hypothetical protein [Streptacidiphilus anmyonensis]
MSTNEPVAENTNVETEAVLSLQETPAAEAEAQDDVQAHNSGLSVLVCMSQQ